MMMRHSSGTALWEWWLMAGVVLLIIAALTLGIVRLARRPPPRPGVALDGNRDGQQLSPSGARQLLDQRYAAGDLGTDEYRERLVTLEQQG